MLRIGAYETRALDERRVERFTVCERQSRLNHSSTAGCNSPATETADIAAVTICAALALIYMHAHTHTQDFLVCLRNVKNRSHAKMQLLTESKIVIQGACRVRGLRSCLGDEVSFLPLTSQDKLEKPLNSGAQLPNLKRVSQRGKKERDRQGVTKNWHRKKERRSGYLTAVQAVWLCVVLHNCYI